jgi:hypothetical protein
VPAVEQFGLLSPIAFDCARVSSREAMLSASSVASGPCCITLLNGRNIEPASGAEVTSCSFAKVCVIGVLGESGSTMVDKTNSSPPDCLADLQ